METVKIELTPEDAELFKQFQKHYLFIKKLEETGAFQMREGDLTFTVHFAQTGEILRFDLVREFIRHKVPVSI